MLERAKALRSDLNQPLAEFFTTFPLFVATFHRSLLFRRALPGVQTDRRKTVNASDTSLGFTGFVIATGAAAAPSTSLWSIKRHHSAGGDHTGQPGYDPNAGNRRRPSSFPGLTCVWARSTDLELMPLCKRRPSALTCSHGGLLD